MLNTYKKRFSLKSFGNGIDFGTITGFEEVVTNGVSKFYLLDNYGYSRIIIFNQYWIYQSHQNLPFSSTESLKYVEGYFYFTSSYYFYKTNSTYSAINYYQGSGYQQLIYDSDSSIFYVANYAYSRIDVFDTFCSPLLTINLEISGSYGLAAFNGNIYASDTSGNAVILQNGLAIKYFNLNQCSSNSITADSSGYLAFKCSNYNQILIYDSNGKYMNTSISTLSSPLYAAIDSKGRFIVLTSNSLDIYF